MGQRVPLVQPGRDAQFQDADELYSPRRSPRTGLAARAAGLAGRYRPGGLLGFDDTGITGHPDHRAATAAAARTAGSLSLPAAAGAARRHRAPALARYLH